LFFVFVFFFFVLRRQRLHDNVDGSTTATAQLDFERVKEMKMSAFVADFMKEYESTGLPPADIFRITFGRLGVFLHLALFKACHRPWYQWERYPDYVASMTSLSVITRSCSITTSDGSKIQVR